MTLFSSVCLSDAITGVPVSFLSLHSDYSTDGTLFEVSTGRGGPITFLPASGGLLSASAPVVIGVPAGTPIAWIGMWDVTNTIFLGNIPVGANGTLFFVIDISNLALFRCPSHGLAAGDQIVVWKVGNSQVLPGGLAEGLPQTVLAALDPTIVVDAFNVSVDTVTPTFFSTSGAGFAQKIVPTTVDDSGTFTVSNLQLQAG